MGHAGSGFATDEFQRVAVGFAAGWIFDIIINMNKYMITVVAGAMSLMAVAYPKTYRADVSTPEKLAEFEKSAWTGQDCDNVALWPEGKIPLRIHDTPNTLYTNEYVHANVILTNVNNPFYRFYPAPGEGVKPCVVICPGGGYLRIGMNKEGTEIKDWLNSLGFSAAVLAYRCSGQDQRDGALCDAQRMIRVLRQNAAKYNVDPKRIGIIGFSAGANLTVRTATNWKKPMYEKVDEADDQSCRPDFQMPIYPWDLRIRTEVRSDGWPNAWSKVYDQEVYPVDSETPPAFIVQTLDDFCEPETATVYDYVLKRAGVDSTLKLYQKGGHGYGLRQFGNPCDLWPYEATSWLAKFANPIK